MSKRYPGGFITKTAPQPTGGDTGTAPGVWTLEQAMEYQKAGTWPSPPPPNYIEDVFSTYLYTGNGSTQTFTNNINLSGKGGMVWFKYRAGPNGPANHQLYDSVRGVQKKLATNTTEAQATETTGLTAFNTNGFTFGSDGNINASSSDTYASWTFRKAEKFFDVVTYTGNSTSGRTVAHNLGSVPGCIIIKAISGTNAGFISWSVYHRSTGNTQYLRLNNTGAAAPSANYWNNTTPTATHFTLGSDDEVNNSNKTYIAYLFAHDAGGFGALSTDNVISCGSYTGNGSSTGPTVTLGYEPQWIMVKRSDTTGNWQIIDNMRSFSETQTNTLFPNLSNAEDVGSVGFPTIVPTATGFKLTNSGSGLNASGGTYIYIAIRRGPMKTPEAGTEVFKPTLTSASTGTAITVGFPTDSQWANCLAGDGNNTSVIDRLRGMSSVSGTNTPNIYLKTARDSAESTVAGAAAFFTGVGNTGWMQGSYASGVSSIRYDFRRAPGFFDVVCYTGNGTTQAITHNLSVAPELLIVKQRSATRDWGVYSASLGADYRLFLNVASNAASNPGAANAWGNNTVSVSPTSTQFTVGNFALVNSSAGTYVAYLFASCPGVSKVGSYTGTGTTLQVNCGFTSGARFVLIKRTNATGDWYVWDSARGIVSGNDPYLLLNSAAAEVTNTDYIDTYSSGFEISSTAPAGINANGGTYIFLAIA